MCWYLIVLPFKTDHVAQGSILALDTALRFEEELAMVWICSGAMQCESSWLEYSKLRRGLKVLQVEALTPVSARPPLPLTTDHH